MTLAERLARALADPKIAVLFAEWTSDADTAAAILSAPALAPLADLVAAAEAWRDDPTHATDAGLVRAVDAHRAAGGPK